MFLLDTTILIDVLRSRRERAAKLAGLSEDDHSFATTTVNIAELYAGVRADEEETLRKLLGRLVIYPITSEIAVRAGSLKNVYSKQGLTIALDDMMIAAVAIERKLVLITDNRRHFPMPELTLLELG